MAAESGNMTCCKCNGMRKEAISFCKQTSLKGVGRAVKTEDNCLRVMWIVAILLFLSITVYNVVTVFIQYLNYEVITSVSEQQTFEGNYNMSNLRLYAKNMFHL